MGLVRRDGITMTFYSYFGAVIGAVNKILLFPNFLAPEQIGLTNVMLAVSAIFGQMSTLGTHMAVVRFFPYFNDRSKGHNGILFWCLLASGTGFSVCTALFVLFKKFIVNYHGHGSNLLENYYYLIIPMAISNILMSLLDGYLKMLYKNTIMQFLNEVLIRLSTTVSIVLFILHWVSFDYFVILYAGLYSLTGFIAIAYTIYIKQFYGVPVISRQIVRLRKQIISYCTFTYISSMSNAFLSYIDVLLIAGVGSLFDTGIYTTVFFITTFMQIPYKAITKVASAQVAYHLRRREYDEIQQLYVKVSEVCFVVGAFLFLELWINLKSIFTFMPRDFSKGTLIFLFVGLGRLYDVATGLNGYIMVYSNKYRTDLVFTLVLIFSSFLLNSLLIPVLGTTGAAITTCFALLGYNSLRIWYVWKKFKLFPFHIRFITPLAWFALLAFAGYYSPRLASVYLDMAVKSGIVAVLFLLPIYFYKFSSDINIWVDKHINKYFSRG